jgi:hypothetical protein
MFKRCIVPLSLLLCVILAARVAVVRSAATGSTEQEPRPTPATADFILEDAPLTIVFSKVTEAAVFNGQPNGWCWSINSAGQAELTVSITPNVAKLTSSKAIRKELKLSVQQMAAIRKSLRDGRFFHLKGDYGPCIIHGGWTTLTVVAGLLTKSVRFHSSWAWVSDLKRERAALVEAAPAVRIWLKVCEVVDPDGKVFEERQEVAEVLRTLKK